MKRGLSIRIGQKLVGQDLHLHGGQKQMLGAIAGDIIGSIYEFSNVRERGYPLFSPASHFTDDTVLTVALADSMLTGADYVDKIHEYYQLYPDESYGTYFRQWAGQGLREPYYSYGNGSAMRVSPVGFAYNDLETVLREAGRSAAVTHNHPEGIKGAQATAAAIFWARQGLSKTDIQAGITEQFDYSLDDTVEGLHGVYQFNETCQETVPQAIIPFLESESFEDAMTKAVWVGGDTDTLACITGGIAEAYYGGVPEGVQREVFARLPEHLARTVRLFYKTYHNQDL